MITPLAFICGLTGGLVLGLIIGLRRGCSISFEKGVLEGRRSALSACTPTPIMEESNRIKRVSVTQLMKVSESWDIEDLELHSTFAVHEITKLLADDLLAKKFIRPVILGRNEPGCPGTWKIGASLLVIKDPAFDDYPTLNYINDIPKARD